MAGDITLSRCNGEWNCGEYSLHLEEIVLNIPSSIIFLNR